VCASSEIERPTRLVHEPPTQCAVNQGYIYLFVDVVDQPVYLCVVGKTYVDYFAEYSERTFLRLRPRRKNHVEMLQNLVEADVDICVDSTDSDRPVQARHPTGRCDRKLPRLALCNRGRRRFLRREFHRACPDTADGG
jgi:hypothetical protein